MARSLYFHASWALFAILALFVVAVRRFGVSPAITRRLSSLTPAPIRDRLGRYVRLPTTPNASFAADVESGFQSELFDVQGANVDSGDTRAGLDERGKQEIGAIMREQEIDFDKARLIWMREKMKANGIDASGRPTDPRAVMFS
ncbi:hypothetical protein SAICODRAFT_29554 [Saitoella complicata NRRL Y-17804]|uniref:Uncharacterized protein n=1 Tax=Saitoella complicata (strain BCRC 22490 / CBS 7301 / JCM 7358 / NBRC 10748 / NRRL Y-17804) TaxID=698492 RepID=A0A0E9N7Y7_SAICN|nr:uncharacterized protein SAICODRAFT_29554 [Saitoella complicata NRRL Y-17804]ODQ54445.1 hypothetical protein SAICODRAFT_29554 [Saitoella complicata NRRL Y-17804]GAO45903.1 hypothetical protein G7K_0149-t1 [Saitoella complicata NRRL Y-17804]